MKQVSEQLIDDHAALDTVLKQLQAALRSNDLEVVHAKLDLFWARLAVHIRAEHLHLFPTVLSSLETANASAPSPDEAQTVTSELRRDHDFFMHELPRAVEITRQLLTVVERLWLGALQARTAMLGYRRGDVIEWEVPSGVRRLKVEEILYQPESKGEYHL